MLPSGKLKAVFLDRDGVINRSSVIDGKPYAPIHIQDIELLPGVEGACLKLSSAGYLLIVVTNQPDVATGKAQKSDIEAIHAYLMEALPLTDINVCYSKNDDDPRRKPAAGMLIESAQKYKIDLGGSYMIGDRWKDIEAGATAGCTTLFIDYGYKEGSKRKPHYTVRDLAEATDIILDLNQ